MWLLDVNLPNAVIGLLRGFGIQCETTAARGWREFGNGELAAASSKALRSFPKLSVVIIQIPQSQQSFESAWKNKPIEPIPGKVTKWP
jgi:hypothetical protein